MERAWVLGIVGGAITSLSGVVGYLVLPMVIGDSAGIILARYDRMHSSPVEYHIVVLTVPSFLVTVAGIIQAHRWGLTSRWTDRTIVGANIFLPVATSVALTIVVGIAISTLYADLHVPSSMFEAVSMLIGYFSLTLLIILFGLYFWSRNVVPIVFFGVGAGTIAGYLVALGIDHGRSG